MLDIPDHWCHVPGKDPQMELGEWKNLTLPRETFSDGQIRFSQCQMIDRRTGNTTKCQYGWEYDKTDYENTISSEFDWVCERDHYATECFSWNTFGAAMGVIIFGILADKYGRKTVFLSASLMSAFFSIATLFFVHNILIYKTLLLLKGFGNSSTATMVSLILAEVSGTDYRAWIYAVVLMGWVIGNCILPILAMICRRWFLLGCLTLLPDFLSIFYYFLLDESPRWLIAMGKAEPAIQILHKIGSTNGRVIDPNRMHQMVQDLVTKAEKGKSGNTSRMNGVWGLFSKRNIAKNTIMLAIVWAMSKLLYYGIILNATRMTGNKFLNYFYLSIIEIPGSYIGEKLVNITGRRWTLAASFLLCTLSYWVYAIVVAFPNTSVVVIIASIVIRFTLTITALVTYVQGTEIFPTELRSTGRGLASTAASFVQIFSPYMIYSGKFHVSLPYAILGLCSMIGLLSSSFLPETLKQNLPETIEDANKFGKGQRFWSYLPSSGQKTWDDRTSFPGGGAASTVSKTNA